jgi:hypothetical protein
VSDRVEITEERHLFEGLPGPADAVVVTEESVALLEVAAQGPAGPRGEAVPGTGDLHYTHAQAVPAAVWVVVHNLGKYPSVSVADSAGTDWVGDVHYDSIDQVTVTFGRPFAGTCYLN